MVQFKLSLRNLIDDFCGTAVSGAEPRATVGAAWGSGRQQLGAAVVAARCVEVGGVCKKE